VAFAQIKAKPNILIILADDMGFSDLSCYGSEIATPHLDQLAKDGVKFPRFYNSARCCPSRAALLTGRSPHEAGVGGMTSKNDGSGETGPYQGYLRHDVPTVAELFRQAGYSTLMSGKWHVGETRPNWPLQRGFDQYFGLVSGASSYYEVLPHRLMLHQNDTFLPPANFYATDAYADSAQAFMEKAISQGKPFFCYTAFTAPHWPLHAPDSVVKKYRERYKKGWDQLWEERWQRQVKLGLVQPGQKPPHWDRIPAWESVKDKEQEAEKMAVYAAMVEIMDKGIGRMVDGLKKAGQYDNTLIVFLSDNGACQENIGKRAFFDGLDTTLTKKLPPGPKGSYKTYGLNWAYLSNTPFRYHKATIQEGGVATPCLLKAPKGAIPNITGPGFITDLLPTALDAAGIAYPKQWKENPLASLEGQSLLKPIPAERSYAWEHQGNKGIRKGPWKLVALKGQPWHLYHLEQDPFETQNRAETEAAKVQELETEWKAWAEKVGVRIQNKEN
jgi:arylsulfatase A-like enzyme